MSSLLWPSGRGRKVLPVLVAVCMSVTIAFGQSSGVQSQPVQPRTIVTHAPLLVLYQYLLGDQARLDHIADALTQQDKDGSTYRNRIQIKLGFTDAQYAPVHTTAIRLEGELQAIDAQVKAAIKSALASSEKRSGALQWPSLSPELAQLKTNRDSVIESEVSTLRASLGSSLAAQLDGLVENQFQRNPDFGQGQQSLPQASTLPIDRTDVGVVSRQF